MVNRLPGPAWAWACDLSLQLALLLVGIALRASPEPKLRWRRGVLGGALVLLSGYASPLPYLDPPALAQSGWVDRAAPAYPVVRQSSDSSCGAAAAATLLRARGLAPDASERTLAELCWTHPRRGTSPLGLWRGLALAAPAARARYSWPSVAELSSKAPCLVRVGLTDRVEDPGLRRVLSEECGWAPGLSHAVVCFGLAQEEGQPVVLIGDPRVGFERWSRRHFEALWHGSALELVPRD